MGFRKDLKVMIKRLLDLTEGENRVTQILEREMDRLREENKELRDRFMSRTFAEYQIYGKSDPEGLPSEFLPDMDEGNAGEILEGD